MSSKRYPEEFKIEAVRQIVDRGYSVAEVADRLGVTTHSLGVIGQTHTISNRSRRHSKCCNSHG